MRAARSEPGERSRGKRLLGVLGGVALALLCLCFVLPLLMAADDGFASLLSGFVGRLAAWFSGWRDSWTEFVVKVFFALPTALYLYGLVYGAVRGRRACVYDKKEVCAVQRGLRFAPRSTVLTALFVLCAVYLLFISMQAKYLFGAFWGALPEGFSYSEYARQGFFELCRVAAINIVILLAANVMSRAQAAENCMLRVCNTALSALTLLLLATGSCKNGALYRGLRPDSEARACKRVSGLDGLRIRVRHPAAVPHCGVGARRGVSGCSAVCAVVCAAGGGRHQHL